MSRKFEVETNLKFNIEFGNETYFASKFKIKTTFIRKNKFESEQNLKTEINFVRKLK